MGLLGGIPYKNVKDFWNKDLAIMTQLKLEVQGKEKVLHQLMELEHKIGIEVAKQITSTTRALSANDKEVFKDGNLAIKYSVEINHLLQKEIELITQLLNAAKAELNKEKGIYHTLPRI